MNSLIKLFIVFSVIPRQVIYLGAQPLPKFKIDRNEISISGFSGGAYFSVQLQVAHSSLIKGNGIIAGIPYDCVRHVSYAPLCSANRYPDVLPSIRQTNIWSGDLIDDTINMQEQKIYMLAGTLDPAVGVGPMTQLYNYYVTDGHYIPEQNVKFDIKNFTHVFPSDILGGGLANCTGPSIARLTVGYCGFDGAGAILNQIYPNLNPRVVDKSLLTGSLIKFDQSAFISYPRSRGLDNIGYAYVPKDCAGGAICKLHISFHGCFNCLALVGLYHIQTTNYDLWADNNNIIVLFPQTFPNLMPRFDVTGHLFVNPMCCWDYLGYYDSLYDTRNGTQIKFVKNIIDNFNLI